MMNTFRSIIFGVLMICILTFPVHNAHAGVWGESALATGTQTLIQELGIMVKQMIAAASKLVSTKIIVQTATGVLLNGDSPLVINNYKKYLNEQPQVAAATYTEKLLSDVMRGRVSGEYALSNLSRHYESRLKRAALLGMYSNIIDDRNKVDLSDYCAYAQNGNPRLFQAKNSTQGNINFSFECFNALWTNKLNHQVGLEVKAEAVYKDYERIEALEREVIAKQNGGVLPRFDKDGNVVTDGASLKAILDKRLAVPFDTISTMGDDNTFVGTVLNTAVPMILQKITSDINKQLNKIQSSAYQSIEELYNEQVNDDPGRRYR